MDDQCRSSDKNLGQCNEQQQAITSIHTAKIEEKSAQTNVSISVFYRGSTLHSSNRSVHHATTM